MNPMNPMNPMNHRLWNRLLGAVCAALLLVTLLSLSSTSRAAHPAGLENKSVTLTDDAWIAKPADFSTKVPYTLATKAPTIDLARYLHPKDIKGNPWSHWGPGLLHSNGKYYCVQGSHDSMDAIAIIYEFDPATRMLRAVADLHEPFDPWPQGLDKSELTPDGKAFGFGKVHGRILEAADGTVYFTSYFGHAERDSQWFYGDRLFSFDPKTNKVADLGRPFKGFGFPSTNFNRARGLLYIEGHERKGAAWGVPDDKYRNPSYKSWKEPYHAKFIVYDVNSKKVIFTGDHPHEYARDMFVDKEGNAYFNHTDGSLRKYDAATNSTVDINVKMPGEDIRRTAIDRNGLMYGVTLDGQKLFAFDISKPTPEIRTIAPVAGDAASLCVDPAGRFAYYVPGSHAISPGGPLFQVDLRTGTHRIVAFLEQPILKHANLYLGGSLSGAVAPDGKTLYLTLHAGDTAKLKFESEVLLVIHLPDESLTPHPAQQQ